MIRQGDLLFIPIRKKPDNLRPHPDGAILAHGEATGHTHRLESLEGVTVSVDEKGEIVIETKDSVRVLHEEHRPVTLDKGRWRMVRQREYDPEEVAKQRRVAD